MLSNHHHQKPDFRDFLFTEPFLQDPSLSVKPGGQEKEDSPLKAKVPQSKQIFTFDNFVPYPYQAQLLRLLLSRSLIKRVFWVLPRRAGKTELMVIYTIIRSLLKAKIAKTAYLKYGIVYPDLASGKEAAWEKMEQRTRGLPDRRASENEGRVTYSLQGPPEPGTGIPKKITVTFHIVGLQDMDKRRGRGYDGLVADECATLPFGWKKVILPMISDKIKGDTFLLNIGTPDEGGDFWEVYDEYKRMEDEGDDTYCTYWTSYDKLKHIPAKTAEALRLELGIENWNIEYGCKRGVVTSARFYAVECQQVIKRGALREIPYDHAQLKWMVADIGSSKRDFFAIWIWQLNYLTGQWEAVDYTQIPSADEEKVFDWNQKRGHHIGQMILPWDAETGMRPPRVLLQAKFPHTDIKVLPRSEKVERIRAGRKVFPRCSFHSINCSVGWNCLKRYSRVWNKKQNVYEISPKHDPFSHGADAFTYWAQGLISGRVDVNLNNVIHPLRSTAIPQHSGQVQKSSDPMGNFMEEMKGAG